MKINIKKFRKAKKLFSKVFKKGSSPSELINPIREWIIGLSVAVVVFSSGIAFTAFDFYTQLVSQTEIVIDEKPLVYRQNEVKFYAEFYDEKEQAFEALRLYKEYVPSQTEVDVPENVDADSIVTESDIGEAPKDETLAEEPNDE